MNVLVATDDLTFSVSLSLAYKALGHSVSAGLAELYLPLREFDLIHLHWPEELTSWEMPPPLRTVQRVLARLDALKPRAKLACTVHNLLPHADRDGSAHHLYEQFYARMNLIGHFSQSSKAAVETRFADIPADRHIVHGMQDFDNLRVYAQGKQAARNALNVAPDALVIAVVGQLRSLDELDLLASALNEKTLPPFQLLRACRPPEVRGIASRWKRKRLTRSLARRPIVVIDGFLDDSTLVAVCEAADIIVIPRMKNQLNSGVLPLAMTFGTGVVAPDCGVFSEILSGSMNELYRPGNADALAHAIGRLAAKDTDAVRASNLTLSADWGWDHGVEKILAALG